METTGGYKKIDSIGNTSILNGESEKILEQKMGNSSAGTSSISIVCKSIKKIAKN